MVTLREIRFQRGLTLYDVMWATGINAARLSLAERGFQRLKKRERQVIADVLNLDVDEIRFDLQPATRLLVGKTESI